MFYYLLSLLTMTYLQMAQRKTHKSCLSCAHFEVADTEANCTLDPRLLEQKTDSDGKIAFIACVYHSDLVHA
jgi:hypothetical protein